MKQLIIGVSVAALAYAGPARAYNNREHQRLPDQAIQLMNVLRRGQLLTSKVSAETGTSVAPLSQIPPSLPPEDAALWQRFINEAIQGPGRLGVLKTGLADPPRSTDECGGAYPRIAAGSHLSQCRAFELPFAVKRDWATNNSDCFLRGNYFPGDADVPEFFNELPTDFTGALLGYYAQNVDEEVRDTVLWFRPTNFGGLSEVKSVATDVTNAGLTVLFAPIACLFALFSGSNCLDDAADAAHGANPIGFVDEKAAFVEKSIQDALPFSTEIDGDDIFSTTGLWHFINVEAGSSGAFNQIGGMHYTQGGWRGGPNGAFGLGRIDALDYGIIIGTDFAGMTLDPDKALGVRRYQQSPDGAIMRRRVDWLTSIGHVEFEPLDNLALYGWRRFQTEHDASGLGWALHALGDAVAPHHGIAATGWGHRPFEDFTGFAWPEMHSEGSVNHYFVAQKVLEQAFRWWRFVDDIQQSTTRNDIPIRELVTALAFDTRTVSDFALRAGVSVGYSDGDEGRARELYGSNSDQVLSLLESGTGATMAFLIKAAQLVDITDTTSSPCGCPPGKVRFAPNLPDDADKAACNACPAGMVEADGQCSAACPVDKPLTDSLGHCTAACTTGPCTGVTCTSASQVVENGLCISACSSANPFLIGHECRAQCPAGTEPSPSGQFCRQKCPNADAKRDAKGACSCPTGQPFVANQACLAECPATAPFFVQGAAPISCLTECPSDHPVAFPSAGPRECRTDCPLVSFVVSGQGANDCVSSCPASAPFWDDYRNCTAQCPPEKPYSVNGSGLCYAGCPDYSTLITDTFVCYAVIIN